MTSTVLDSGVVVPTAPWLIEENARPGTEQLGGHRDPDPPRHRGVRQSGQRGPGDDVALFVNTTAAAFHVEAYRMGYYQGLGGQADRNDRHGRRRPANPPPTVTPGVNTVYVPMGTRASR